MIKLALRTMMPSSKQVEVAKQSRAAAQNRLKDAVKCFSDCMQDLVKDDLDQHKKGDEKWTATKRLSST